MFKTLDFTNQIFLHFLKKPLCIFSMLIKESETVGGGRVQCGPKPEDNVTKEDRKSTFPAFEICSHII